MDIKLLFAAVMLLAAPTVSLAQDAEDDIEKKLPNGEYAVKPYVQSNANAGAEPFENDKLFKAFNGKEGIDRITDDLVARLTTDPRTKNIFRASDLVRLRRTLKEQLCYLLGGPCTYTGQTMKASHKDQGVTRREFNILVELMQQAMNKEGVPFSSQNKLLAKLAPMYRDVVTR